MSTFSFLVLGTIFVVVSIQLSSVYSAYTNQFILSQTQIENSERGILSMVGSLQESALTKFYLYTRSNPNSIFAKGIIEEKHIQLLTKTTYAFRNTLCNIYRERISGPNLTNQWIEFDAIISAISMTCEIYGQIIQRRFAEVLKLICRLEPISLFHYLNFHKQLKEPNIENLSLGPLLETAIKRYFLSQVIGDNFNPESQPLTKKLDKNYAFGDEADDYDDYTFDHVCADVKYLVRYIKEKKIYSKMAKREADIFTVPSLRELHKTPRRFKKILCEVFIDMLMTNPMINPPTNVEISIRPLEEIIIQRRWEAFYALKNVCFNTVNQYFIRTNLKMQLVKFAISRPLAVIMDVHKQAIDRSDVIMIPVERRFGRNELVTSILKKYNKMRFETFPVEGNEIEIDQDDDSEPGVGDENSRFDLKYFEEICILILRKFYDFIKNVENPSKYRILRRRLIDMRYKAPRRFKRIICQLYETGKANYTQIKQRSNFAFGLIPQSLNLMFKQYADRSFRHHTQNLDAFFTASQWRKSDPFYFMFHMHIEVLQNSKDEDRNHVAKFLDGINRSESCRYDQPIPLPESFPLIEGNA